jgi:streptomycin 6-kinase
MNAWSSEFTESILLEDYLKKWTLLSPEKIAETLTSHVYKVQHKNQKAVLKLLTPLGQKDETDGAIALRCYGGNGAVSLIEADEGAHLLSFADGRFLKELVTEGRDVDATEIICDVLAKIHGTEQIPATLTPMNENFRALFHHTKDNDGDSTMAFAARTAKKLLETESETVLLHGDIHHKNILESSDHGWVAIDPKGLIGERTYDFANVFYNPDDLPGIVENTERIENLCGIFYRRFGIDKKRILEFAFAYG